MTPPTNPLEAVCTCPEELNSLEQLCSVHRAEYEAAVDSLPNLDNLSDGHEKNTFAVPSKAFNDEIKEMRTNTNQRLAVPSIGTKHDQGKAPLSMIPKEALEAESFVFEYGAKKYGRNNYRLGMNWSRLVDASMRHIVAFANKEDIDPESGLQHLAHARASLAMLIYYASNKKGVDDR